MYSLLSKVTARVAVALTAAWFGLLPGLASRSLLIQLTDSTVIVCSLDKEPQMEFGEKTVTLASLDGTIGQWDFADVVSWRFAEQEMIDAIGAAKPEDARISINGDRLIVSGKHVKSVTVYDMSGRTVTTPASTSTGLVQVSLRGFPRGTYLLKVDTTALKFFVK